MTDQSEHDAIDRLLGEAIGGAGDVKTDPDARRLLVARMRRRHLRRRQMVASGAAVVVLIAGAAAFIVGDARSPAHGTAVKATRASSKRNPTADHAGLRRSSAPTGPTCVEVEVGGGPAVCAGSFAAASGAAAGASASLNAPQSGAASRAGSAPFGTANRGSPAAGPEETSVGSRVTVRLPARSGIEWSEPRVATNVAGGARSGSRQAVLRPLGSGRSRAAGATVAVFEAVRPGTAVIDAVAHKVCGTTGKSCGPVAETWSLTVVVDSG